MSGKKTEASALKKLVRREEFIFAIFVVIIIAVFSVFVIKFYNMDNDAYRTESALIKSSTSSVPLKAVFIRNEQVLNYTGGGVLSYSVPDGGKLGKGSVIAEVYSSDSQIQINQQLALLEEELEILNQIKNPGTLQSAQPAKLSSLIEEKYRNIVYYRDMNNIEEINAKKDDLLVYMSTYQLITNGDIDLDTRIYNITAQIMSLKANVSSPNTTITSDYSAYFSSVCDGYEDVFTKENISEITIEQLNSVEEKINSDSTAIGKTIDNYEWYVAGVVDNTNKEYEIDQKVMLKFESTEGIFKGTIVEVRDEGNPAETIVVVFSDGFNDSLVQHRCDKAEIIKGEYTGLKVPRDAIRFKAITETVEDENGIEIEVVTNYKGVNILQGEQVVFKKLDEVFSGTDYILSAVNSDSDYLSLYDEIIIEGVDS